MIAKKDYQKGLLLYETKLELSKLTNKCSNNFKPVKTYKNIEKDKDKIQKDKSQLEEDNNKYEEDARQRKILN